MLSYQHSYSAVSHDESTSQHDVDIVTPDNRTLRQKLQERCSCRISVFGISVAWLFICIAWVLWLKGRTHGTRSVRENATDAFDSKYFDNDGRFIVHDFDIKPAFSDFLPGVAGVLGKPNWVFYVNRGQAIASFGTQSKEYPILEFKSANIAYQSPYTGFRTFIQGLRGKKIFLSEPFNPERSRFQADMMHLDLPKRTMYVGRGDLEIVELDFQNQIETSITYFTLPEEEFSSLVRIVKITNLDKHENVQLSVLDGLAHIEPAAGEVNGFLKNMGRTLEAWKIIVFVGNQKIPVFKTLTVPGDTAYVRVEEAGHYCISFVESDVQQIQILPIIYDTRAIFGDDTTLMKPHLLETKTISDIIRSKQYGNSTTASAFSAVDGVKLMPSENVTILSFYGKVDNLSLIPDIALKLTSSKEYIKMKHKRAQSIVNGISTRALTNTRDTLFNEHVLQMFLDNSLRGGLPLILGDIDDKQSYLNVDEDDRLKVFHTFSRVHGDLERDYNNFLVDPTFYSQGPGNFRDVVQNRRNDVSFEPRVASFNVRMITSFLQADGYNPLSIESIVFVIRNENVARMLATKYIGSNESLAGEREGLYQLLHSGPFRPGQLLELIRQQNIPINTEITIFINEVSAIAEVDLLGQFQSGYWADHWTYLLDLINNYLSIYPDREESLMYDEEVPYFFSPASVRPRCFKYVLSYTFDYSGFHIRQLNATDEMDQTKLAYQRDYINSTTGLMAIDANWQNDIKGNRFFSPIIGKLFLLCTVKFATRDAMGMGIEYEAGKPGWNDSLNGLVGMIGSGIPESYELKLLLEYTLTTVLKFKRDIVVPTEIQTLIDSINGALDGLEAHNDTKMYTGFSNKSFAVPQEYFLYWDQVASARESYREAVRLTFSGTVSQISYNEASRMLNRWVYHVTEGLKRALYIGTRGEGDDGSSGISPTYFSYNITDWIETGEKTYEGFNLVNATAMAVEPLPLFLEGPTRMLKSMTSKYEAKGVYQKLLSSGLRDTNLNMFTISSNLKGQSMDLGRVMAFSPGWLENQSVWMHMSYKFYLELLRKGLYTEFFSEMENAMLPFLNESIYGRPLTECSSFIASSAFTDPSRHGEGFIARLSGATAEFMNIWVLMMIGPYPFTVSADTDELQMQLRPALPLSMFRNNSISEHAPDYSLDFLLFSSINVTYHNQRGLDLLGSAPESYEIYFSNGTNTKVENSIVPSDIASLIRRVAPIDSIKAYFI